MSVCVCERERERKRLNERRKETGNVCERDEKRETQGEVKEK